MQCGNAFDCVFPQHIDLNRSGILSSSLLFKARMKVVTVDFHPDHSVSVNSAMIEIWLAPAYCHISCPFWIQEAFSKSSLSEKAAKSLSHAHFPSPAKNDVCRARCPRRPIFYKKANGKERNQQENLYLGAIKKSSNHHPPLAGGANSVKWHHPAWFLIHAAPGGHVRENEVVYFPLKKKKRISKTRSQADTANSTPPANYSIN